MLTFGKLVALISESHEFSHQIDSKEMRIIRTGLNLSENFWDQFIQVCNNMEDLSELLGVSTTTIVGWAPKIKEAINKVKHADSSGKDKHKIKNKIINTGDLGGITATEQH